MTDRKIQHEKSPHKHKNKLVEDLSLQEKIFLAHIYDQAQSHPKRWFEENASVTAKKFDRDRTRISVWLHKLIDLGFVTPVRVGERGDDKFMQVNRVIPHEPPEELYAELRRKFGLAGPRVINNLSLCAISHADGTSINTGDGQRVKTNITTTRTHSPLYKNISSDIRALVLNDRSDDVRNHTQTKASNDAGAVSVRNHTQSQSAERERVQIEKELSGLREKKARYLGYGQERPDLDNQIASLEKELVDMGGAR
jgi:hypothetical protein